MASVLPLLALAAAAGTVTQSAFADSVRPAGPRDSELPYRAWQARTPPKPGSPPLDPGPMPVLEEPEQARRLWELVPDFGVALPGCAGRPSDCRGIRPGLELGASVLYRPYPYVSIGVTARLDVFSLAQAGSPGVLTSQATFFGVAARLYAFESGIFDPYLELALGGGSLGSGRAERNETTHVDLAPAARIAGGVDLAFGPWLRLGPSIAWSQYASGDATYCSRSGCVTRSAGQAALPRSAMSFGLRLTVALGERL